MVEPVIEVRRLGKTYRIYPRPWQRLAYALPGALGRRARAAVRCFHALDEVSFSVARGEVVGILGRNGSGKSTLLQLIAGTVEPTHGSVRVIGRVAALLELGAGFNPEFSGLENVRLNAAILGLSPSEIERRIPEILAFADIGEFVYQPVKTYSSGMYVRLAFAVAACVEPDVLIVDEALAVGDVKFQARCFRRFEELVRAGTTILLVTHSTEQVVRHCQRALLLDGGRLIDDGDPREVSNRYLDLMLGAARPADVLPVKGEPLQPGALETRAGYCHTEYRWGEGGATLYDAVLSRAEVGEHVTRFAPGERATLTLRVRFARPVEEPVLGFFVKTPDGVTVYGNSTLHLMRSVKAAGAGSCRTVVFAFSMHLGMGSYLLSLGVSERVGGGVVPLDRRYDVLQFDVVSHSGAVGLADLQASCVLAEERDDA